MTAEDEDSPGSGDRPREPEVEEAFDRPVTNRYGCEEVSLIACECEEHDGLHLNADGVYCEVMADGRLLVTDLTNRAMPLIRYQVGDVVVPSFRTPLERELRA